MYIRCHSLPVIIQAKHCSSNILMALAGIGRQKTLCNSCVWPALFKFQKSCANLCKIVQAILASFPRAEQGGGWMLPPRNLLFSEPRPRHATRGGPNTPQTVPEPLRQFETVSSQKDAVAALICLVYARPRKFFHVRARYPNNREPVSCVVRFSLRRGPRAGAGIRSERVGVSGWCNLRGFSRRSEIASKKDRPTHSRGGWGIFTLRWVHSPRG